MGFFDYTADGHLVAEHDGRKAIDTRRPMLTLVPAAQIVRSNFAISFPDLFKGTIYHQHRQTEVFGDVHGCSTWIGLVGQEWGPHEPGNRYIADEPIDSVPAGTDYLEIWVKLSRTQVPARMVDLTLGSQFPENEWVKLDGYSCIIEELMGVSRQFEFVLDGTTVSLRRRQSVTSTGANVSPRARRVTGPSDYGNKTFFFPGSNAPEDGNSYATYGQRIDEKGTGNGPTHRPPGYESGSSWNVPCNMSHAGISYASTWTGDIRITPGRLNTP